MNGDLWDQSTWQRYTLFVVFVAAVQFALCSYGTAFARGFLHIDLDIDAFDSIFWGALFYALLYLLALPKNIFIKYV